MLSPSLIGGKADIRNALLVEVTHLLSARRYRSGRPAR
ncbi:energy transducer TonB [Acetobacter orientalis]|uniref:Energy transducer TonB n=1 Tax=Acetobacter orientalis TaxID=146474 RepID=A0A2Z5ZJR6_9PROT|nr:energy transducer TonB [Acetobacter orientalis]